GDRHGRKSVWREAQRRRTVGVVRLYLSLARRIVSEFDIDLSRTPVCLACLSFVSAGLRQNDERDARHWAHEMTPMIWEEGLAEPALEAARGACVAGVRHAEDCLADLELRGGRSVVARAIVLRLAADLAAQERRFAELHRRSRGRLEAAPPEWN